jgi:hypothetical protein
MAGWFGRLFGGGVKADADDGRPNEAKAVDYKGFRIVPAPRRHPGGWLTAGVIVKEIGGSTKQTTFVRADILPSRDEAEDNALRKGQRIVDEQGEALFDHPAPPSP